MAAGPAKLQPALFGGLFIGVVSALPIIGAANCICCLWAVTGGMLATYLMQQNYPLAVTSADGALVGLIAGLIGGVVSGLLLIPIVMAFGPMQARFLERIVSERPDLPPQMRDMIENMARPAALGAVALIKICISSVVYALFAMLGGLLGVALFKKQDLPPPPGTTVVVP